MPPSSIAALAAVKSLNDCSNFQLTVAQHLPQLQSYVQNLAEAATSVDSLKHFYLTTNPLVTAFVFALAISPVFLTVSEINRNYSQVDRCWSLLPTVYALHYAAWAHANELPTQRLGLVAAVGVCWSTRLTYNYYRRGGYSIGSEDYRWVIVKDYVNSPVLFFIFDAVFISLAQMLLLFAVHMPTYVLLQASRVTGDVLMPFDYAMAGAMLVMICLSAVADQQQWNYQTAKNAYQKKAKVPAGWTRDEMERGFNTRGMWAASRHPNFACEQSVWVLLYQWSCFASYSYYNWSGIGALAYLLLFQASTWLTELITAGKYPEYKNYQSRVSRFLPKLSTAFTGPVGEKESASTGRRKGGAKATNSKDK